MTGLPDFNPESARYARKGPTVRHKVLSCGHKFLPAHEPRFRNCESCWFAFFQVHGELTRTATELFHEHGIDAVAQIAGSKFAKNFVKFMATLAQWKKQYDAVSNTETKEHNEQGISGVSSRAGQPGIGGSIEDEGGEGNVACVSTYNPVLEDR